MNHYKIFDWAGNDKSNYYGTFETFDDAWSALYEEFEHLNKEEIEGQLGSDFDQQMGEFYVEVINEKQ